MTEMNSPEYYRRREKAERELASRASNPAIALIHKEMADRYAVQSEEALAPYSRVSGLWRGSRTSST